MVADPKGTRLNQGFVHYGGLDDWGFKVGRQRINQDNQRFDGLDPANWPAQARYLASL